MDAEGTRAKGRYAHVSQRIFQSSGAFLSLCNGPRVFLMVVMLSVCSHPEIGNNNGG